jgi:hypothetical protein
VLDFIYRDEITLNRHLQFQLVRAAIGNHHIFEMDILAVDIGVCSELKVILFLRRYLQYSFVALQTVG